MRNYYSQAVTTTNIPQSLVNGLDLQVLSEAGFRWEVINENGEPNEADLQPVRSAVDGLDSPYRRILLGYYLPVPVTELPTVLEGTAERP